MQTICDEEAKNPSNYPSDAKYSFQLSFEVKKADGSYKTYTNQTMLSFYKKKNNNDDFGINYSSPDECNAAIAADYLEGRAGLSACICSSVPCSVAGFVTATADQCLYFTGALVDDCHGNLWFQRDIDSFRTLHN